MKKIIFLSALMLFSPFFWREAGGEASAQEKTEASIQLSFYKKSDYSKTAIARVTARNKDKRFVPAANVRVCFYAQNNKEQQFLKNVYTNHEGIAGIEFPKDLPIDKDGYFNITAKIENDSLYEDAEEQIRYKEAHLTLKLQSGDTDKFAIAIVTETGSDGKEILIKETEVKFYVQRLFGQMPAAEDYAISTDDNGEATLVFPKDIPGDTVGNLTVIARIEDNEQYGNVESRIPVQWGVAVPLDKAPFPRALWGQKAPIPLILTLSILFGGIWATYFFVFYQLRRIKKEKIVPEDGQVQA